MNKRASGLLLHITSLPSAYGIGDLGPMAYRFVDFLSKSSQKYWQILPLNITDGAFNHSPYSSISAFAGNTLMISPELLVEEKFLTKDDLEPIPDFSIEKVDYAKVELYKNRLFESAVLNFMTAKKGQGTEKSNAVKNHLKQTFKEYDQFCQENQYWLDSFSLFVAIKAYLGGQMWNDWPVELRDRHPDALKKIKNDLEEEIEKNRFLQYLFYHQWHKLKTYCQKHKVEIIGDIPIYVSYDSADVWTHPELFKLDENKYPRFIAGVPPDYFSATGQRWGNPVYEWESLRETKYRWWIERLKHNFELFDLIRIDHFRGFLAFWEVPIHEETAVNGHWCEVPAEDFFKTLQKEFHSLPVIAEDLGIITPDVVDIMHRFKFPGMKVLLFAFGGNPKENPYMPKNHVKDCVVYTGTHDNNTTRGWFERDMSEEERNNLFNFIGKSVSTNEIAWSLIEIAMRSVANTAMIPMQDILNLGAEARMNTPATVHGNWLWRLTSIALNEHLEKKLSLVTHTAKRA